MRSLFALVAIAALALTGCGDGFEPTRPAHVNTEQAQQAQQPVTPPTPMPSQDDGMSPVTAGLLGFMAGQMLSGNDRREVQIVHVPAPPASAGAAAAPAAKPERRSVAQWFRDRATKPKTEPTPTPGAAKPPASAPAVKPAVQPAHRPSPSPSRSSFSSGSSRRR